MRAVVEIKTHFALDYMPCRRIDVLLRDVWCYCGRKWGNATCGRNYWWLATSGIASDCWSRWLMTLLLSLQRFTQPELFDQSVYILMAIGGLMFILGWVCASWLWFWFLIVRVPFTDSSAIVVQSERVSACCRWWVDGLCDVVNRCWYFDVYGSVTFKLLC